MQLRTGDESKFHALNGLTARLNAAYQESHRMRSHADLRSGSEYFSATYTDVDGETRVTPRSWNLKPMQVEELRAYTAELTGADSDATKHVADARDKIKYARASFAAGDFVGASDHANSAINHFHTAEEGVREIAWDSRPRLSGPVRGIIAGATLLAIGTGVAALVSKD